MFLNHLLCIHLHSLLVCSLFPYNPTSKNLKGETWIFSILPKKHFSTTDLLAGHLLRAQSSHMNLNIWTKEIPVRHLSVIVDINYIHRAVSVTDEEDGVIVWLQHLKEVNIRPAVDKNEVSKLQHNQNSTFSLLYFPSYIYI